MAKTYTDLFSGLSSFEALHRAWGRVIRGRRHQTDVLQFERDLESNLIDIQNSLIWKTYRTGPYYHFRVFEPKEREIAALPLKDRVVQHALIEAIEPIWTCRFISDSYACQTGKGMHAGADRAQTFLRATLREHGIIYVLKADIARFFPSVCHDALKRMIARRVACKDTLWLIDSIIDSVAEPGATLPRGIPIGNLTSQIFANIYLHELDEFVKHELRERRYVRYMDDFAIIGADKEHLHRVRVAVDDFLYAHLGLRLNRKTQVFPVSATNGRALDFLGYRIWPTHRKIRKDSAGRIRRKMKRMARQYHEGKITLDQVRQVVMSWVGHAGHASTYTLRSRILGDAVFIPPPSGSSASRRRKAKDGEPSA